MTNDEIYISDFQSQCKENLMSFDRQLRLAKDKADGLTIKKLTKNSPSLRDKFKELGE